jgi:hypothetical protein
MMGYIKKGAEIRDAAKLLVLDYLRHNSDARSNGPGVKQAVICRECGLDWGDFPKATSSNQQYWTVALLKELEATGQILQIRESGPWRLKSQTIQ